MQIDLANTLVHKVYFVYHVLFIIARKLGLPSFGGAGGGFGRGGRGRFLGEAFGVCIKTGRAHRQAS